MFYFVLVIENVFKINLFVKREKVDVYFVGECVDNWVKLYVVIVRVEYYFSFELVKGFILVCIGIGRVKI